MHEKLSILEEAFGPSWKNNDEFLFGCPSCDHSKKKLSVNIEKNVFKCWICNYSGKNISTLISKFASSAVRTRWFTEINQIDLSQYEYIFQDRSEPKEKHVEIQLPAEFATLTGQQTKDSLRARRYLDQRGVTMATIKKWRIGYAPYGPYGGRIIVPSFDILGRLNYFIGRSYMSEEYKYKNPKASKDIIFNELDINWDLDIVLVEGVFDAFKCDNAIPLLGSTLRNDSKLFDAICRNRPKVFVALDPDAKNKEFAIANNLRRYGIEVWSIDISGYADVGEMPSDEFLIRKSNASFVKDTDYLRYKLDF